MLWVMDVHYAKNNNICLLVQTGAGIFDKTHLFTINLTVLLLM